MFCKICGSPIDQSKMKCTGCGAPVEPLTGGVGFWDLAGAEPLAPVPSPDPTPAYIPESMPDMDQNAAPQYAEEVSAAPAAGRKRKPVLKPAVIVLALSLVLNVVLLVLLLKNRDDSDGRPRQSQNRDEDEENEDQTGPEVTSESTDPEDTSTGKPLDGFGETEEPTDPEETEDSEATTDPDDQTSPELPFEITKQPRNEKMENFPTGEAMFSVEVAGENLEYRWEMWDSNEKTWVETSNTIYLYEKPMINKEGSELYFTPKCDDSIYTWYRCIITDAEDNQQITEEVCMARNEEDIAAMIQAWEELKREQETTEATEETTGGRSIFGDED